MKPLPEISRIPVDLALWQGNGFAARLRNAFRDVVEAAAFREFVAARASDDPTAVFHGWRRGMLRSGRPLLVASVTWKSKTSDWSFAKIAEFETPLDLEPVDVFDADLPRIGFSNGIAVHRKHYNILPGLTAPLDRD